MRGSSALRTSVAPGGALAGPWARNPLWTAARAVPSLDLCFADTKSLVCATTGQNLVSHSRASSATFVDSTGVLRSAVTNLLLRSEEFNDAAWTKSAGTVSANSIASPTGAITADTFVENTSNALHRISGGGPVVAGSTYTTSVYAKYAGRFLYFNCNALHAARATFDLQSGTVATVGAGSAAIVAMGNGWYRCSVTGVAAATATDAFYLQLNDTSVAADKTYTGDGTSGIFIWGAQLEQSATVGEYIPTTSTINSAPRFDHNPTTGESLGLLVEEARTNEVRSSSMTGGATGTPGTYPTGLSTNAIATGLTLQIAALGTDAGVAYVDIRVSGTTTNADGFSINLQPSTDAVASSGQTWTGSCYCSLVAGSYSNITAPRLRILERTAVGGYLAEGSGATITATGTSILQARATVTRTLANALTARAQLGFVVGIASGVAVDFTFRFAAPQLEAGAFPTSYIPTTTATVTRAADVASISGANFSSWYNQTEGTAFTQYSGQAGGRVFMADDGTGNNRFEVRITSNTSQLNSWSGGTQDVTGLFAGAATGLVDGVVVKTAIGLKVNDAAISTNGFAVGTDTSCAMPIALNRMILGSFQGNATFLNGTIRRLTYWPTRLGNEVLQRLTQP